MNNYKAIVSYKAVDGIGGARKAYAETLEAAKALESAMFREIQANPYWATVQSRIELTAKGKKAGLPL